MSNDGCRVSKRVAGWQFGRERIVLKLHLPSRHALPSPEPPSSHLLVQLPVSTSLKNNLMKKRRQEIHPNKEPSCLQ